jgi:hypothetical protein
MHAKQASPSGAGVRAGRLMFMVTGLAAAMAGCGGSDYRPAPPPPPPSSAPTVPASALVSVAAFSAYVGSREADDRGEPLMLDGVVPPTSETDEPAGSE